jgi:hypothetical protein
MANPNDRPQLERPPDPDEVDAYCEFMQIAMDEAEAGGFLFDMITEWPQLRVHFYLQGLFMQLVASQDNPETE